MSSFDKSEIRQFALCNCRPFLNDQGPSKYREYELLRGEKAVDEIAISNCPVNRRPRNMQPIFHQIADEWFLNKFGVRYRSNAVFCTSDSNVATTFGLVRYIYPVGPYSVCWSPNVFDMYFLTSPETTHSYFLQLLENADYREGGLRDALASRCEIMLHCNTYISSNEALI